MQVRRPQFRYPDDFDAAWNPRRPEVAAAANAVSLLMPHAEPLVALAVREAATSLAGAGQRDDVRAYVRQELQHQRHHRRLNELLIEQHSTLKWVDWAIAWTHRRIAARSLTFRLAYTAGFETVAYGSARWVDDRLHRLFAGADPTAASLFLWHLAEEAEHKSVAFDVFVAHARSTAGRRRFDRAARVQRLGGMVTALTVLGLFCVVGSLTLLAGQSKRRAPLAVARLARESISLAFDVLPLAVVSLLDGHDPRALAEPSWYGHWLDGFDPDSGRFPPWDHRDASAEAGEAPSLHSAR